MGVRERWGGVGWGWALINFFRLKDGRLFEVGANSRLGAYSNKYGTLKPVLNSGNAVIKAYNWSERTE